MTLVGAFVGVVTGVVVANVQDLIASGTNDRAYGIVAALTGFAFALMVWSVTWLVIRVGDSPVIDGGRVVQLRPGDQVRFEGDTGTGIVVGEEGLVIDVGEAGPGNLYSVTVRWGRAGVVPVVSNEVRLLPK